MAGQRSEAHRHDQTVPAATRSDFSGSAGEVVQARDVSGGIHFHAGGARRPVPRQAPAAVPDFTGRSGDVLALDRLLNSGESGVAGQPETVVISAIDGAAGIGKTTLAVYWAHRVRDRFPDGTLYVNLRGYGPGQPVTADEVLGGFLRALGAASAQIPAGAEEQAALYRSLLDGRRVLVVLDNANTPEQVRLLFPGSPGCLALITSRSSMAGLVIGHGAARVSLDLLPFDEAAALVRRIIGQERADAEPGALADIVRACARLPLALRVAGQRAASRPRHRLADIAAELTSQQDRLDTLSFSGDELTMVRTVLDWSYRALPPEQARLFRLLGLHPGPEISVHAAAALADAEPRQVRLLLEALADVHMAEATDLDRYQSHDLLRAYALEQAEREETPEDIQAAVHQVIGFYLHTADAADQQVVIRTRITPDAAPAPRYPLVFPGHQQALNWARAEYPNLVAAASHAARMGMHALAWQLSAVMSVLLKRRGHVSDLVGTVEAGLASARALGDHRGEGYLLVQLGSAFISLRKYNEALDIGQRLLSTAQKLGNQPTEASALEILGDSYRSLQQHQTAISYFERAADRASGDAWHAAIARNHLGEAYRESGRLADALRCHHEALAVFRETNDADREGWTLRALGDVHQALGQLSDAIVFYQQTLDIAREIDSLPEQASALTRLGNAHEAAGDSKAAISCWRQALAIFEQIGYPEADDVRSRLKLLSHGQQRES
jgi:tetratricopeptide (TPR) repeat protein